MGVGRDVLDEKTGWGRGWVPNTLCPKNGPNPYFLFENFIFSHNEIWIQGGGGGGCSVLLRLSAVLPGGGGGGATPRFWTPTTAPTDCWPEAPWGGGGQG